MAGKGAGLFRERERFYAFTFGLGVCGCLHEERQHSQFKKKIEIFEILRFSGSGIFRFSDSPKIETKPSKLSL